MLKRSMLGQKLFFLIVTLLLAACTIEAALQSDSASQGDAVKLLEAGDELAVADKLEVPDGYQALIYLDELEYPTQMVVGSDGWLWVAQLAGSEADRSGNIVAISPQSGERRVIADGLAVPTGIAIVDNWLWVATQRDLLRAAINEDFSVGEFETIREELPYNGRSNGTLTVTPEQQLLFISSGTRFNASESGELHQLSLDDTLDSEIVATGLKNAYAHVFDATGRLWVTEVADDIEDDASPLDELNLVVAGGDYGWPKCTAAGKQIAERGGTQSFCDTTTQPVATFPPHTTPTGLAVAPWNPDQLLIALWVAGDVVALDIGEEPISGEWTTFIDGLKNPQHLLALADGSLLISDYSAGVIYKIVPTQ